MVEENVKQLGYTSKAELIREAVREFLLKQNIGKLGLLTYDRKQQEGQAIDPQVALKEFRKLKLDPERIRKIIEEERDLLEKLLLNLTGET